MDICVGVPLLDRQCIDSNEVFSGNFVRHVFNAFADADNNTEYNLGNTGTQLNYIF